MGDKPDRRGWLKLHRIMYESQVWLKGNSDQYKIFSYLLMVAVFERKTIKFGRENFVLKPGYFYIRQRAVSEYCRVTRRSVRTAFLFLEDIEAIEIIKQEKSRGTIGRLVNWKKFQVDMQPRLKVTQGLAQSLTQKTAPYLIKLIREFKEDDEKLAQVLTQKMTQIEFYTFITKEVYKENKRVILQILKELTAEKSSQKDQDVAATIYETYNEKIEPGHKTRGRAIENISYWLKFHPADDLLTSALNYESTLDSTEPRFRKDAANFFGKKDQKFLDYLPGKFKKPRIKERGQKLPTVDELMAKQKKERESHGQ